MGACSLARRAVALLLERARPFAPGAQPDSIGRRPTEEQSRRRHSLLPRGTVIHLLHEARTGRAQVSAIMHKASSAVSLGMTRAAYTACHRTEDSMNNRLSLPGCMAYWRETLQKTPAAELPAGKIACVLP